MNENGQHPVLAYCVAVVMLAGIIRYILFPPLHGNRERTDIHLAKVDIYNLIFALDQFQIEFGEFRKVTNEAIHKALLGENSKKNPFFLMLT